MEPVFGLPPPCLPTPRPSEEGSSCALASQQTTQFWKLNWRPPNYFNPTPQGMWKPARCVNKNWEWGEKWEWGQHRGGSSASQVFNLSFNLIFFNLREICSKMLQTHCFYGKWKFRYILMESIPFEEQERLTQVGGRADGGLQIRLEKGCKT